MIHFGIGDVNANEGASVWIEILAHGGMVISGISMSHMANVDDVFSALLGGESTSLVWVFVYITAAVTVLSLLYCMTKFHVDKKWKKTCFQLFCL